MVSDEDLKKARQSFFESCVENGKLFEGLCVVKDLDGEVGEEKITEFLRNFFKVGKEELVDLEEILNHIFAKIPGDEIQPWVSCFFDILSQSKSPGWIGNNGTSYEQLLNSALSRMDFKINAKASFREGILKAIFVNTQKNYSDCFSYIAWIYGLISKDEGDES